MTSQATPPHPQLVRKPTQRFGWLDATLLQHGWFARIGSEGIAVMTLLAIVADRHGASFYNRDKMAQALGMSSQEVDHALERLLELKLLAYRPWRKGCANGIWQLMPVPAKESPRQGISTLKEALSDLASEL